jgi:hypothetical protein
MSGNPTYQDLSSATDYSYSEGRGETLSWLKLDFCLCAEVGCDGIGPASGFFLGFALEPGCIGAALLGKLTDITSINFVYRTCLLRPAVGFLTAFLPILRSSRTAATS